MEAKREATFHYTEKRTHFKWNTITGYPGLVGTFEQVNNYCWKLSINILRANKRCKNSWDYTSLSKEVCLEPTAGGNKLRMSQLSLAIVLLTDLSCLCWDGAAGPAEIDPDTMPASLLTKMQPATRARHFCLIISSTENRFWMNCQKSPQKNQIIFEANFFPTK